MGMNISKANVYTLLTAEEKQFVENSFKILSRDKDLLKSEELVEAWCYIADEEFVHFTRNACFRKSEGGTIKIKPFVKHFYVATRGNVPEKALFIATRIFDNHPQHPQGVISAKLQDFVRSVLRSYFIMLHQKKPRAYSSWLKNGVRDNPEDTILYCDYLIKDIIKYTRLSIEQIDTWLSHHPMFMEIWREVVIYIYGYLNPYAIRKARIFNVIPYCNVETSSPISSILNIVRIMLINECIPMQYRFQWTLLFNSKLHGESFKSLIAKITDKGPTILLIKDKSGHIFGGYAPASWMVSPTFKGDITAALFTLTPKMDYFHSSGHNDHFQYLNSNQQTMPNGLGMGGQMGYWGLWVNENFTTGATSQTCSTFRDYSQMSGQIEFQLAHLEVWGVNHDLNSTGEEDARRSVLTERGADKFVLELAGHKFVSDGYVEEGK